MAGMLAIGDPVPTAGSDRLDQRAELSRGQPGEQGDPLFPSSRDHLTHAKTNAHRHPELRDSL